MSKQTDADSSTRSVRVRAERYLISGNQTHPATDSERFVQRLSEDPEIRLIRVINPASRSDSHPIAVVEMSPERAARLVSSPEVFVEADKRLRYGTAALPYLDPGVAPQYDEVEIKIQVEGGDGRPLEGAMVHLFAEQGPVKAETDRDGRANLTVAATEVRSISGIYVKPRNDHWSAWLGLPELSTKDVNKVVCAAFDAGTIESWARRAMGFDRLPPTFTGHGVKVAIIDSGITASHTQLVDCVKGGRGLTKAGEKKETQDWKEDRVGFGTVAAGILVGTEPGSKIFGLAPEVDLRVCKVFPGGRTADLIEAISYCIDEEVDVISLGLGSPYPSWLVARKIEEARHAGIACIAAAGSTAGQVIFPAALPNVLSVAAVGKLGTFPPGSYHATQLYGPPSPDGFFAARFSSYGPEIDVCAPGVAVVSTVPPSNLGAQDGTAVAVPHIAALAALILAHHPEFRDGIAMRSAARVDRLFQVIRASCQPMPMLDPLRVGAGMPNAVAALGLTPPTGIQYAQPVFTGLRSYDVGLAGFGSTQQGSGRSLEVLRDAMHSAGLAEEMAG